VPCAVKIKIYPKSKDFDIAIFLRMRFFLERFSSGLFLKGFFLRTFFNLILVFICFSCSQKPAQIINRGGNFYSKNNQLNKEKYLDVRQNKVLQNRQIKVSAGETLYSISKKYQVTLHDLIRQNHFVPPYNLKSGTKITIPAPAYHEIKPGDTLYGISRAYNMKIDNLIEINDLKKPYNLKTGEKIRISNFIEDQTRISDSNISSPNHSGNVLAQKSSAFDQQLKNHKKIKEKIKSRGLLEKTLGKFNNFSGHFSWPVRGPIISNFGPKSGGLYNDGINIKAKEGTKVEAATNGVVAYVGNELKGYGNLIIIKHSGGWITAYAHLQNLLVKRGAEVVKGQEIGTVGSTGNVSSAQLYFGLRKGRDAVNPENYLN
jgi:murein DD-endopeptidase MepM/ murein hydrolase activator NlpD